MLKKVSAILLIVVANILLLGHTIVPHHHHGEHICICNYSEHSHDNTAPGNAQADLSSGNYSAGSQSSEFDRYHTGCSHGDNISGENSNEECSGDTQNSCNSCPVSGHSSEGKCNFLDLLVLIPVNETKSVHSSFSENSDFDTDSDYGLGTGSLPGFFIAYLNNQLFPDIPEPALLLKEHHDKTPLLCGIYFTKGLRAPPAV